MPNWPAHVTGDEMVAAMDKVGIDGAIFISASSMYCYDASYAVEEGRSNKRRLFDVLHVPPISSPVEAVRAAIVAEHKEASR